MTALVWVALAILAAVLGAEAIAWCVPAQRWMLRKAVAVMPKEHRDRYLEEWMAELEEIPNGPVTRSLWACQILLHRHALARDLGGPSDACRRSRPQLVPFAAAAALLVIAVSALGLAAKSAEPDDRLFPLAQVLYPKYARSVEATRLIRLGLEEADLALQQGRQVHAEAALEFVEQILSSVDAEKRAARADLRNEFRSRLPSHDF